MSADTASSYEQLHRWLLLSPPITDHCFLCFMPSPITAADHRPMPPPLSPFLHPLPPLPAMITDHCHHRFLYSCRLPPTPPKYYHHRFLCSLSTATADRPPPLSPDHVCCHCCCLLQFLTSSTATSFTRHPLPLPLPPITKRCHHLL